MDEDTNKVNRTTALRLRNAGYVETTAVNSWEPGGSEPFTIAITDAGLAALHAQNGGAK